ncbi:MAG: ATP-grasp domain-containing protein [Candidatus Dojkabacteria bacterium]|nr:ATP-grasp domain-containing protein [Candidatus Dojkabacteria bacterium]MDQ7021145.1 ATP-grasp domain-containing protein [Candidatus Dojkabacteria bacterium]
MVLNIQLLVKACKRLGLKYSFVDENKNFLEIIKNNIPHYFIQFSTPKNNEINTKIFRDKGFTYDVLKEHVRMPKTIQYLYPEIDEKYREYLKFENIDQIISNINSEFKYPIIIKKNRGAAGNNVFISNNNSETKQYLNTIYKEEIGFDYIALAQELINIEKEYRVLVLDNKVEFFYEKSKKGAQFNGNLSPLHWEGAEAILIDDLNLKNRLQSFIDNITSVVDLNYGGLDIAIDVSGEFYLIEINSTPGFSYFIDDNGESRVIEFFEKVIDSL